MRRRCDLPSTTYYARYGGRGIAVCHEWLNYERFRDWAMANGYAPGLTIDRVDNDGDYCPDNCRWVTQRRNSRNTSRVRPLTAFGETKCLADWVDDPRCVVTRAALRKRVVEMGWDAESALTTPRRGKRGN